MSSHHFVRDGQEPALLIMNTNGLLWGQLQSLLEWNPSVLVSSTCIDEVISWGIKVDSVLGKIEDGQRLLALLSDQFPLTYVSEREKSTALSTGLCFLMEKGHMAINVIGSFDNSADTIKQLLTEQAVGNIVVFDEGYRWVYCKGKTYKKWAAKGDSFQVRTKTDSIHTLSWKGLRERTGDSSEAMKNLWESKGLCAVQEGTVYIESDDTRFWVGESLD